jgi:hypothetical protein
MRGIGFIALLFSFLHFSCTEEVAVNDSTIVSSTDKEVIELQDAKEWMEENKTSLTSSKEMDKIFFRAIYVPSFHKYISEYGDSAEVDKEKYAEFTSKEFYIFSIGLTSGEGDILKSDASKLSYDLLLDYLAFRIQNDIHLEVDGKSYPCKLAHFERTYGIKPFFNVNLVFDKPDKTGDRKIVYDDKIFETGVVKLNITEESLISVPEIKTN